MAEAAAALQAQINAAVVAALAAQAAAAVPAQVAHVAVKLPDFWVKDPKMWFSQAEAQFRRARITAETTMYDYILMKLPQDVVMSVRALVSAIEADPVKQEQSYTLMKEADFLVVSETGSCLVMDPRKNNYCIFISSCF